MLLRAEINFENRFMGCHGYHALSHSPHKLFLRTMFSHLGSPIDLEQ